jgi:hypothetical protein
MLTDLWRLTPRPRYIRALKTLSSFTLVVLAILVVLIFFGTEIPASDFGPMWPRDIVIE